MFRVLPKKAAFKNHPRNIFRDKNHFYAITWKHLLVAGYWLFLKIAKTWNFVLLTDSLTYYLITITSLEPRWSSKWSPFYTTTANSPVRCSFWGSNECGASVPHCFFYLPLGSSSTSCNKTISMCQFLQSTLSLSSVSRCHNINFKALALL